MKERWVRGLAGGLAIACGLFGLPAGPVAWLVVGLGATTAVSGLVGFCPACALTGRRLRGDE